VKLIDTHAHLGFHEFDKNRAEAIARAAREGVGIIDCSLTPKEFQTIAGFKDTYKDLYFTIGCTPYHLDDFDTQYKLMQDNADKIVAVGEIGLDYYWVKDEASREKEKENFLKLIALAKDLNKPVLIHSRNAEKQALDILKNERVEKAIMHCFSGYLEDALHAIDMGYLVSIPTNVTLSKQKQEFAQRLPLESLVLETDAPYLSPEPGKQNEPVNVIKSARKIAELRGISFEEVCSVTTKNAKSFFGI
jgi:TatD DNase family protein